MYMLVIILVYRHPDAGAEMRVERFRFHHEDDAELAKRAFDSLGIESVNLYKWSCIIENVQDD